MGVGCRLSLAGLGALLLLSFPAESAASQPAPFTFTWSGLPATPQPWTPADWDVIVHSRDTNTFDQVDPMWAQHGSDCSPPPATHMITTYEDAVFVCRNHLMTAINGGGYGAIYLTPNRLVDFSTGTASIRYSVSTTRASGRDWHDIWITPFDDNLVLPLYRFPDLQGPPRNAIHIQLVGDDTFNGNVFRNFVNTDLPKQRGDPYDNFLQLSALTRTSFELDISRTHIRFGMPAYQVWWIDIDVPDLGFNQGVIQLGHHSYDPTKAANGQPGTWHWSDFSISSAVPFTMLRGSEQSIHQGGAIETCFTMAAPPQSRLRFAGIGNIEVSYNGGRTFVRAQLAAQVGPHYEGAPVDGLFASYWTPVPEGISSVVFRGTDWWAGPWRVRDPSIWSQSQAVLAAATGPCPHPAARSQPPAAAGTTGSAVDVPWLTQAEQRLHAFDHTLDRTIGQRNLQLIEAGLIVVAAGGLGFVVGRRRRRRGKKILSRR